ncbi:hypothetical protein [Prosthecomicrobium sp. N25]|uniref:hypothetical protein n=1 Tax=Prosthecomicrobium sp. N25 TaxID=3129254 RepID=UPI003076AF4A
MNRASPQLKTVAKQLVVFETPGSGPAEPVSLAFRATDKLTAHLSMLMGRGGCQALLARALSLATVEVPWLGSMRVVSGGGLDGLPAAPAVDAAEVSEGEVVLLAQLLRLLVAFIGPALTSRLIRQNWPQLSFNDADFGSTANNEDAQ